MQFITDVKPGECEILTPSLVHKPLLVVDCWNGAHVLMQFAPPPAGWTHDALCALDIHVNQIADAFLGKEWVGSTEI